MHGDPAGIFTPRPHPSFEAHFSRNVLVTPRYSLKSSQRRVVLPARKNRVTRWTDDRGNVLEDFKGLYEQKAIENARKAGIPGRLLDRAGWNGDEDDIAGLFTDLIYRVGCLPLHGPVDPMSDAEELISAMRQVCDSVDADYREAVPFGHLRFIRDFRRRQVELRSVEEGTWIAPEAQEGDYREGSW
jgi:hypothetical protein